MPDNHYPQDAFIVVTSGVEAKFFRNVGTSKAIKLSTIGGLTPKSLNNDGPSGKRPPESSSQETDEATFAKQLAQELYSLSHKSDFETLVLVADPNTLGQLRPILHQEVTSKITAELNKTFINSTTSEIEKSLQANSRG